MMRAIDKMGFVEATNVQAETIPLIREGVDILAQSQTGTGKTMAFAIPCVERINQDIPSIQALILSPTRELAQQCGDEVRKLTRYMPHVKTANIYGGGDYKTQFRELRQANLVIGTPGRIMDHMKRGTLKLKNLQMIILDEADEMLNMGFKEDIETILKDAPEDRQTLLFSATIPKGILEITRKFQNNATRIDLVKDKATISAIKQIYVQIPRNCKNDALNLLLHYYKPKRSIVFANTKSMVDELAQKLYDFGFSARGLHGDMRQNQRTAVMSDFKNGKTEILIATDVAARGIDVNDIDFVFNYDIPKMSEFYVHRIGRTGRAGKDGTAVTLCCGRPQFLELLDLSKKLKCEIEEIDMPTVDMISSNDVERNVKTIEQSIDKQPSSHTQMIVDRLTEQGFSLEQISLALADIAFSSTDKGLVNLPEFKKSKLEKPKSGKGEKGRSYKNDNTNYGKLKLSIGHTSRCCPNHIVGAITERTGITSKLIGKIIIDKDYSLVEVPNDMVEAIVGETANLKICGKSVSVTAYKTGSYGGKGSKSSKHSYSDRHKKHETKYGKNKKIRNLKFAG